MIRHPSVIAAVLVTIIGPSVGAQEHSKWGISGDWAILMDPSTGNGCLMEKRFDDSTVVQFGAVPNREGGFIAAYNPSWTDIEDGESSAVNFDFDEIRFTGSAVGVIRGELYGGIAFFDNPNVPMEIAKNRTMTIIGESGPSVDVDLTGTHKAIEMVKECQAAQP